MTEQVSPIEQGGHPEILNINEHGALYGRFLLASLPGAEISNIIDPSKTVEFNDLTASTLEKRNYNPVFENLSFVERKEEWKEVPLFDDAYSQWRTKFTTFMTKIQDSSQRETALRIIMSNSKKATEFTVSDAEMLFNKFCKGESNIAGFVDRIVTNLTSDGKIDPANLQELLPHLQWIASGLFGKNTASIAVTRLIELESAMRNNTEQVIEIINSNKNRINTPTEDEKKVLGLLHNSLLRPQESKTVIIEPTPKVAPTTPEKKESDDDKDKDS